MNHSALKTFAQGARRKLRELAGARLDYILTADTAELRQQAPQINELRAALKAEGREALVERVAYTWFNRLAALRFMDANGYHPFGARVVTPATPNETLPELLQQARAGVLDPELASVPTAHRSPTTGSRTTGSLITGSLITELLAGRIPVGHPEAQVYRLLLVAACNYYHRLMPFMFEKIGDATELLLPEDLLTERSVVHDFRVELTDDDCRDVELLGWLYQYYISERKDAVMARKAAVPKEDIPAVTQLFTPHWIVRYLVENSLGRLWLLNRPHSRLREIMPYYIEGDSPSPAAAGERRGNDGFLRVIRPEDIRLLDPACGSGHMLTYSFDLLYAIYEEEGYDASDIPRLILQHNLHGVEICDRAAALAAFALCMKARARDSRFFRRAVQPHLIGLQDIHFDEGELREYIRALELGDLFDQPMVKLLHQFEEAKNFGSLIQPCLDEKGIAFARGVIEAKDLGGQLFLRETHAKVLDALEQAEYLCQRYHVVVANPPYMKYSQMTPRMRAFVEDALTLGRANLCTSFLERQFGFAVHAGYSAMILLQGWMFTSRYEPLRKRLLQQHGITTLAHFGAGAFDTISGEVVQTAAFVAVSHSSVNGPCVCFRLTDTNDEASKERALLAGDNRFVANCQTFALIPGSPMAYWASQASLDCFLVPQIDTRAELREGIATGDNPRFVRFWSEVSSERLRLGAASAAELWTEPRKAWVPLKSGGSLRKWFGNNEKVIRFDQSSYLALKELGNRCASQDCYFKPSLTWSDIGGTSSFGVRFCDGGYIFSTVGHSVFAPEDDLLPMAGFLCSVVASHLAAFLNPTMHANPGDIARLPYLAERARLSRPNVETAVTIARADWDNQEASWDFLDFPLLRPTLKRPMLASTWSNWKAHCDATIRRMQELETENNRLFIAAYGLEGELQPEVPEDQITLARADPRKDMAAFISYAVGCMFGRYSLDAPGLILADAGATVPDYDRIVAEKRASRPAALAHAKQPPSPPAAGGEGRGEVGSSAPRSAIPDPSTLNPQPSTFHPTFAPDPDGILPVLEGEWFADDIVARFREFLRVTFGEQGLAENLAFVEASLGKVDAKTGKAKPTDLRTYFVRDFYKNHLGNERAFGYKKRPIYWMFSSPEGSFQALIYLHRYTRDTVNLLLNEYVREFIHKLEARERELTAVTSDETARPGDRTRAVKELGKIARMLKEVRAWERDVLLPLAQQRIELDLDDGVRVNYQKFKGALVPIPGLERAEGEEA